MTTLEAKFALRHGRREGRRTGDRELIDNCTEILQNDEMFDAFCVGIERALPSWMEGRYGAGYSGEKPAWLTRASGASGADMVAALGAYGTWLDFFLMLIDFITSEQFKELLKFIISLFAV